MSRDPDAGWPAEYAALLQGGAESPKSGRSIARRPSHNNLWVDFTKEPPTEASAAFMENMIRHEMSAKLSPRPLPIQEAVGFASGLRASKGSVLSSVFTLVASAMGAGCLSLPHMLRQSGLGLGLALLACGALLAHVSLVVLMSCARYTRCRTFADLVQLAYSKQGRSPSKQGYESPTGDTGGSKDENGDATHMKIVVDTVIALYGVAAVLIYMMLIGDFLGGIAQSPLFGCSEVSRGPLILGSLVVVLPLSLPHKVSALRHVCILSTGSIIFMMLVVMALAPGYVLDRNGSDGEGAGIVWATGDFRTTLQSFAISIFAFAAHTNAVPVVVALEDPRAERIWNVSLTSVALEFVVYAVIAVAGYISFLGDTQQDFIRNYPSDDTLMLVVRCIYSVPVVFGVPINLSPAAASLQSLARRAAQGASSARLPCSERTLHYAIVTVVLAVCTCLAVWSEAIADVMGLMGSFFGTLICLWWPRRVYKKVLGKLHNREMVLSLAWVLWMACIVGVVAFLVQAYDAFTQ